MALRALLLVLLLSGCAGTQSCSAPSATLFECGPEPYLAGVTNEVFADYTLQLRTMYRLCVAKMKIQAEWHGL